jgi:hypothetical protein
VIYNKIVFLDFISSLLVKALGTLAPSLSCTSFNMPNSTEPAPRFPPLTPANGNLDADQLVHYEFLADITKKVYGNTIITKDTDGKLEGPFNMLL